MRREGMIGERMGKRMRREKNGGRGKLFPFSFSFLSNSFSPLALNIQALARKHAI